MRKREMKAKLAIGRFNSDKVVSFSELDDIANAEQNKERNESPCFKFSGSNSNTTKNNENQNIFSNNGNQIKSKFTNLVTEINEKMKGPSEFMN